MNKKGFTLVEILAVIVILGLIMTIVATKGFGAFDSTKNKIAELNEDAIKESANVLMVDVENCDDDIDKELYEAFGKDNCSALKSTAKTGLDIPLSKLIELGYISGSDIEEINDNHIEILGIIENEKKRVTVKVLSKQDVEILESGECNKYEYFKDVIICNAKRDSKDGEINKTIYSKNPITTPGNQLIANERTLSETKDDYGISYYFRGNVKDNYVNFAGKCWRIVRIDGNGNIRLILASNKGTCEIDSNLDSLSAFIRDKDDYLIADYQYSGVLNKFLNGGDIEIYPYYDPINAEYGDFIWDTKTYSFMPLITSVGIGNSIANIYQCTGGEAVQEEAPWEDYPYYYRTESAIRISGGTYTLVCDGIPQNSSKIYLLTPDELKYAGTGTLSYLYENARAEYWLNYEYSGGDDVSYGYTYVVTSDGNITSNNSEYTYGGNVEFYRPVVSLVSNIKYLSGTGNQKDPYEVVLSK